MPRASIRDPSLVSAIPLTLAVQPGLGVNSLASGTRVRHGGFWILAALAVALAGWGGVWLCMASWRRRWNRRIRAHEEAMAEMDREHRRLQQENNRRDYDMIVLYQFLGKLALCRSTGDVYQAFVSSVEQSINPDTCVLFLLDPDGGFHLAAERGFAALPAECECLFTAARGLVGWVAASASEILVEDSLNDERFPELKEPALNARFQSAIAVPLLYQNRVLGVVAIGRASARFTRDELRLLFILANEGALYLQNLRLYEEMWNLAIIDGSTGLYNHRYFFEQVDLQLTEAREYGFGLSLLMIDIDNFKLFNDRHGHLTGDAILKEAARIIGEVMNPDCLVARYGGEEFAVLMPDADPAAACAAAEEIRRRMDEHEFTAIDGRKAHITVSIGLATYPDHLRGTTNTVIDLIATADNQLVACAKLGGRNRVCCPDPTVI